MIRGLVLGLVLACGCAHVTAGKVLSTGVVVGTEVLKCLPEEYAAVRAAIAHGGSDWMAVVMGAWQCIEPVVQELEAQEAVALATDPLGYMVADAADETVPPAKPEHLSAHAKRRLTAAKVLGALVRRNVAPAPAAQGGKQ
jgi:hypothetical protein